MEPRDKTPTYAELVIDKKDATRIREDCEYKWGGIYDRLPKAKGTRGNFRGKAPETGKGQPKGKGRALTSGGSDVEPPEVAPTLEELGVDKKFAARCRRRAKAGKEAHEARADASVARALAAIDADAKKEMLAREARLEASRAKSSVSPLPRARGEPAQAYRRGAVSVDAGPSATHVNTYVQRSWPLAARLVSCP